MFPPASVAEQVTTVSPKGNILPDAGAQLTAGAGSQLSVAVGVVYETTVPAPPAHSATMSAGQAIVGSSSSVTAALRYRARRLQAAHSPAARLRSLAPRPTPAATSALRAASMSWCRIRRTRQLPARWMPPSSVTSPQIRQTPVAPLPPMTVTRRRRSRSAIPRRAPARRSSPEHGRWQTAVATVTPVCS